MFTELIPLLASRTMVITVSQGEGDQLTVTVFPKSTGAKDENPASNTPLYVTGTATELDRDLPGLLAEYTGALGQFHSNLAVIKKQLDAAAAEADAAKKAKTAGKTAGSKPVAKSAPALAPKKRGRPSSVAPPASPIPAPAADPDSDENPPVPATATDGPIPVQPPGKRRAPVRGRKLEAPPVPSRADAPPVPVSTEPLGLTSEQEDPAADAANGEAQASPQAVPESAPNGWADEAADGAAARAEGSDPFVDTDDPSYCPF